MAERTFSERVEQLEVSVRGLDALPGAVKELSERVGALGSQMSQFRGEVRAECSAIRQEMAAKADREEMREDFAAARDDLLTGLADLKQDLGTRIDSVATRLSGVESKLDANTALLRDVLLRLPAPRRKR